MALLPAARSGATVGQTKGYAASVRGSTIHNFRLYLSKLEIGMPRAGTIGVQRMRLQEFGERFGSSNRRLGGMEALSLFGASWASRAGSASNPRPLVR